MNTFDFSQTPDRRGSGAFKWDLAKPDEIPMWVADMDFAVSPAITTALSARIAHPVFGYSGVPRSYRDAVAAWEAQRNAWTIDPATLLIVPSIMPAMAIAVELLTDPGDAIATFSPVYFPFFDVIEQLGRRVVRVPLAVGRSADGRPHYHFDSDALSAVASDVRALFLCSPHNPGGRVWTRDELESVRAIAATHDVAVVSDEIHSDLVFPGVTHTPWLTTGGATARDVVLIAPSKTFNIPGLPTATAVIPDRDTRALWKAALEARKLMLPNLLSMVAAEAAYRGGAPWLDALRPVLQRNYERVVTALSALDGVDVFVQEGTFIAWIDARTRWGVTPPDAEAGTQPAQAAASGDASLSEESVSRRFGALCREQGVWLSDGRQFGPEGEGCMRINFATNAEQLETGLERVRAALESFTP